jgi:hypothetical protein
MESSEQEFRRLIAWTRDNPGDWHRICDPDSYDQDIGYMAELVERLYKEKLFTVIYFVFYTNTYIIGVDWAITRTVNECFLDSPVQTLVGRFRRNLELAARDKLQKQQEEHRLN